MDAIDIFNTFGDQLVDPKISDAFDGLVLGLIFLLYDMFSWINFLEFIENVFFLSKLVSVSTFLKMVLLLKFVKIL